MNRSDFFYCCGEHRFHVYRCF